MEFTFSKPALDAAVAGGKYSNIRLFQYGDMGAKHGARFYDRNLRLGSDIEVHAFAPLEASRRVINSIPLGCPLL